MDGASCHWEPVPREGKFLYPVENPAKPHPFISGNAKLGINRTLGQLVPWGVCLHGADFWWVYRAWGACGGAGFTFFPLSDCLWVSGVCCVGCSPRGSKCRAVLCHGSASLLQHSPGQFFLLSPVSIALPHVLLLLSPCPGGRTLKSRAAGCPSFRHELRVWAVLFLHILFPRRCLSVPLATPRFDHLPVLVPSSWTPCSQVLAGQGSFITLPYFAFMLWSITFCSFWIPVAPAGINHWSWVSGALPWLPVKGCC